MDIETQTIENMTFQQRIGNFITNPRIQKFILGLIIFNAITMGLETFPAVEQRFGGVIGLVSAVIQ